jgi:hypothetical protein
MSGKRLKLEVDLIPESCFKTSIRKSMQEADWDKISQETLDKAGDKCEICGSEEKIACHEIWQYDDTKLVQKLKGFRAICRNCYAVEHFGISQVLAMKGYLNLNEVIKHFCSVNGVTWDDFNKHKEKEFARHRERSGKKWTTDFGKWGELIIQKGLEKKKK